tara:strand:+ start:638 stop:1408 length:771 start_codon:yes stop_codon:yes gene_type:complete
MGLSVFDKPFSIFGGPFKFTDEGVLHIGDNVSNSKMTTGLTIKSSGGEAFSIQSPSIEHGMTGLVDKNTFSATQVWSATAGGFFLTGYSTETIAQAIIGRYTTDDTTKSTAASAPIVARGQKKSGDGVGAMGADSNIFIIQNHGTTRFIFDVEGSGHADVEWVAYDKHDDLALVQDMEQELLLGEDEAKTERRHILEEMGIIGRDSWHKENGKPRAMVNFTKLAMLHHGALLQSHQRIEELEQTIERLETQVALLN